MLRIIGVSGGYFTQPEKPIKYCQMWYSGSESPHVVQAEYQIVPETHGRR